MAVQWSDGCYFTEAFEAKGVYRYSPRPGNTSMRAPGNMQVYPHAVSTSFFFLSRPLCWFPLFVYSTIRLFVCLFVFLPWMCCVACMGFAAVRAVYADAVGRRME